MAVAMGIYAGWRSGAIAPGFQNALSFLSLCVCPPFILSVAVSATPDAGLALALTVGTIVFANGFLYAGVAAGGYFLVSMFAQKKRPS